MKPPTDQECLTRYLRWSKREVDQALDRYLAPRPETPAVLLEAMRHATLSNGKRVRPALLLAACECCGGDAHDALPMACALEMMHIASLIHDDLPAMDNDDLRRGVPSLHKVYGEAVAILAGDALIVYAFQVAAESSRDKTVRQAMAVLARAAGASGMAGGQVLDLTTRAPWASQDTRSHSLDRVYLLKTASLIEAAVQIGSLCAGASPEQVQALGTYGRMIGLAFQVIDDILDSDADQANGNLSYCVVHGKATSTQHATEWIRYAHQALVPFGQKAWMLHDLADFILQRRR